MKIKEIIFSLVIIASLNLAYAAPTMNNKPGSIERYAWVGGNKEGTVVAFMYEEIKKSRYAHGYTSKMFILLS